MLMSRLWAWIYLLGIIQIHAFNAFHVFQPHGAHRERDTATVGPLGDSFFVTASSGKTLEGLDKPNPRSSDGWINLTRRSHAAKARGLAGQGTLPRQVSIIYAWTSQKVLTISMSIQIPNNERNVIPFQKLIAGVLQISTRRCSIILSLAAKVLFYLDFVWLGIKITLPMWTFRIAGSPFLLVVLSSTINLYIIKQHITNSRHTHTHLALNIIYNEPSVSCRKSSIDVHDHWPLTGIINHQSSLAIANHDSTLASLNINHH